MTGMAIGAIASALVSGYSAYEQHEQAKYAERQQKEALRRQEELAFQRGPEATAVNEEDQDIANARKRLLRRGFLGTLNTGMTGLGTQAETAGTGLKGTLG